MKSAVHVRRWIHAAILGGTSSLFLCPTHAATKHGASSTPRNEAAAAAVANVQLPLIPFGNPTMKTSGYYSYSSSTRQWSTPNVKKRLETAGKALGKKGLVMAIGDLSYEAGGEMKPHKTHRTGRAVDLRLMTTSGVAAQGSYGDKGYSKANTLEMVKALIDADSEKISRIFINSSSLAKSVRDYLKKKYKRTDVRVGPCEGHDNHIHIDWAD